MSLQTMNIISGFINTKIMPFYPVWTFYQNDIMLRQ